MSDPTSTGGSRPPDEAIAARVVSVSPSDFSTWMVAQSAGHASPASEDQTNQGNSCAPDAVDPAHYRADRFELINVLQAVKGPAAYCRASAIKYLFRAGNKPGQDVVTDLMKAERMIRFALEELAR